MKASCVTNARLERRYEGDDEVVYFTIELSALRCSRCNWSNGWAKKFATGMHPCEAVTKLNQYLWQTVAIRGVGDDIWQFTYRLSRDEVGPFIREGFEEVKALERKQDEDTQVHTLG